VTAAQPAYAPESKAEANLAATAALAGYELRRLADGSFTVSRWGFIRPLPDLHAVAGFLRQVGAR